MNLKIGLLKRVNKLKFSRIDGKGHDNNKLGIEFLQP
jgi:hypothetical protein